MDNDQLKILLKKYKLGECTEAEVQLVESWYNAESAVKSDKVSMEHLSEANANIWGKVIASVDLLNAVGVKEKGNAVGVKEEDNVIRIKEDNDIAAKVSKIDVDDSKIVSVRLWPRILRITSIAAAVAAITLGVWLYYASGLFGGRHRDHEVAAKQIFSGSNDVAPGKNTATLTLANGKTINLSDTKTGVVIGNDKLAYNDGSLVGRHPDLEEAAKQILSGSHTRHATMLTASTPRGGQYTVTLPDGTKVWLNADSKISFPSQFYGKERKILLSGEAYFEVVKNKNKPFVVKTDKQEVEVLGTHFNINAYNDESNTKTTLLEGSVRVYNLSEPGKDYKTLADRMTILKPNQQATLTANSKISIKEVDPESAVAWKNGDFNFKEEDLQTAMLKVARWYDVEVIYDKTAPKDLELGGWVSRKRNISAVLKMIESTGKVHFKVEGRRILVTK